jgi:hypothetical protein
VARPTLAKGRNSTPTARSYPKRLIARGSPFSASGAVLTTIITPQLSANARYRVRQLRSTGRIETTRGLMPGRLLVGGQRMRPSSVMRDVSLQPMRRDFPGGIIPTVEAAETRRVRSGREKGGANICPVTWSW